MIDRTFADRLQKVIDSDPELTAAGLAVKAGLNNSTIRGLLSGRTKNVRVDTANKICKALETTLDKFMSDGQPEEEAEIARLVSQLPEPLRRQLIGYGEALLAAHDQARSKPRADDE